MPIDEAGLAAAVNAGISEGSGQAPAPTPTPAPSPTPPADNAGGDSNATQTDAGGDVRQGDGGMADVDGQGEPADSAADGGTEGGGEGADDAGAAGDEGTDGAPDGAPADGAAKPAAEPAALTEEERLKKAMEDPIPNALKRETKERIHTLTSHVKKASERAQVAERDLDTMVSAVTSTGATPVQYRGALEYLRLVNSESVEDKETLLGILQREIRAVATMLGRPVAGVNFLEGHDDLIREVGEGRLSQQRAMEIAAARERDRRVASLSAQRRTQEVTASQATQIANEARASLNALGQQLQQSDPQYKAKMTFLGPTLRNVMRQLPPSQWVSTFQEAYAAFKLPAAAAAPAPAPKPLNTPLRPNNPAGGQQAAPKSSLDAVNNALSQLGR